jgi:uncharacterized protein YukE
LLRRLGRAAVEKMGAVGEEGGVEEAGNERASSARANLAATEKEKKKRVGFFVAKEEELPGYRPKPKYEPEVFKPAPPKSTQKKVREPSPQPSVKSDRAPMPSKPLPKQVRIKGKDGKEAFVQLPEIPRAPPVAAEKPAPKPAKPEKKKPVPAKQPPKQKTKPKDEDDTKNRAGAAKVAAQVLMSGAMPAPKNPHEKQKKNKKKEKAAPKKAEVESVHSSSHSAKDSGIGLGGMFEKSVTASAHFRQSGAASTKSLQEAVRQVSQNSSKSKSKSATPVDDGGGSGGWAQMFEQTAPSHHSEDSRKSVAVSAKASLKAVEQTSQNGGKSNTATPVDNGRGWEHFFEQAAFSHHSEASRKSVSASAKTPSDAVRKISEDSKKYGSGRSAHTEVQESWQEEAVRSHHSRQSATSGSAKNLVDAIRQVSQNSGGSRAPSNDDGWNQVGQGWVGGGSQRSVRSHESPVAAPISRRSSHNNQSPSNHDPRPPKLNTPTIFAGEGWITPHPLSEVSTHYPSRPRDKIVLPPGLIEANGWKKDRNEISFEDFQAVKNGKRNFSRTESMVSQRVVNVAASIAGGSATNKKAIMASAHSSQRSASWHSGSRHSSRREGYGGEEEAGGWRALPGFGYDGSDDGGAVESHPERSARAASPSFTARVGERYRGHLEAIVEGQESWSQVGAHSQHGGVQLEMPWDRQDGSRLSGRESYGSTQRWLNQADDVEAGEGGW